MMTPLFRYGGHANVNKNVIKNNVIIVLVFICIPLENDDANVGGWVRVFSGLCFPRTVERMVPGRSAFGGLMAAGGNSPIARSRLAV